MFLIGGIGVILFSLAISGQRHKDLMSPAVIVKLPWLLAFLMLIFSGYDYDQESVWYLYLAIGLVFFDLGFHAVAGQNRRSKDLSFKRSGRVSEIWMKRIMALEGLLIIFYLILAIRYVSGHYQYNFYFSLKYGSVTGDFRPPFLIGYLINFSVAFSAYVFYQYISAPKLFDKRMAFIQMTIGVIVSLMTLGRTTLFLYVVLMLSMLLIGQNVQQQQMLKYGLIFFVIGLVFFGVYNVLKYPYINTEHSLLYSAFHSIIVYLSGSVVAFEKWAGTDHVLLYGANTFRFFVAMLNRLGFDFTPQNLVNPFIDISATQKTNVYTIYYYYISDFGFIYGYAIQFLFGAIHGFLYKKLSTARPLWLYFFSLSLYPLAMQFFQDQYLSLTSSWIQFIFYGLLFFW